MCVSRFGKEWKNLLGAVHSAMSESVFLANAQAALKMNALLKAPTLGLFH
jgi:hypothetical protein